MNDYEKAKRYAEGVMGVDVLENREWFHTACVGPTKSGIHGVAMGWGDQIAIHYRPRTKNNLKAWVVCHELGHIAQWRSGYIYQSRINSAYPPGRATEDTLRIERDAWRRAGKIARAIGIDISEESRQEGRDLLDSYKACVR